MRRDLRDRPSRRRGAPDHDGISFLEYSGGDPVRRPHGLAGDPVEPQKPVGDRQGAGDQDGAATGDDRGDQKTLVADQVKAIIARSEATKQSSAAPQNWIASLRSQ